VKKKAKKRPGRPAAAGGREKLTTTLSPVTILWLRAMGTGSISRAIESFVTQELAKGRDFWEQAAKDNGYWDESMKKRHPVNQRGERS
jgi:hypothetical protein